MTREGEGMLLGFLGALGIVGAFLTWRGYKAKRARRDNAEFREWLNGGNFHVRITPADEREGI